MKYFTLLLLMFFFNPLILSQWQIQNSGTTENLNDITVAPYTNGNPVFIVGDDGTILKTTNNGNEWVSVPSGTTNRLNAVSFSDSQYGIAVGNGVICLTTDGGESWSTTSLNKNAISVQYYMGIYFGFNILLGCDDGTILFSSDAGITWQDTIITNEPVIVTGMIDIGMWLSEALFVTNLLTAKTNLPFHQSSVWNLYNNPITTEDHLICGELNWDSQYLIGTSGNSGSDLLVLKKSFRDTLWTTTHSAISASFIPEDMAIYYDYDLFICGNDGKIFASIDDGSNWLEQNTGVNYNLNSIAFGYNTPVGYSVGDNGTILFTSNGGGINSVGEIIQPDEIVLYQNYPNPFNPSTNIEYKLNSRQYIQLKIFDVLGNEITTLVNEEQPAGTYNIEFDPSLINSKQSSGIYFYQLSTTGEDGNTVQTRKMIFLK
jgi:hypothetical protein